MKKISLLAAVAAVVLASCSKSSEPNPNPEEGVKTYMSLSVDIAKANTRAHYGDLEATADESVIDNVTVFVFNSNGFLEETVTFDNPGDMTKTFTVTTGAKTFLAAANITGLSFAKGTTHIDAVKGHKLNIAGIDDIAHIDPTPGDSRFWMTSLDDVTATLTEITDPAQVGGSSNDITIRMGRAAAKVGVYYNPNPANLPADGTLSNVEYRIHNNQKGMYLFAHTDAAGNRKTPFYDVAFAAANYFDNVTSINDGYLGTGVTFDATLNRELHDAPSYMVENSNKTISNYTVTYASVRGRYVPSDVLDPTTGSTDGSWSAGDDFWRIANVDGSGKVTSYEPEYYSSDPDAEGLVGANQAEKKYTGGVAYYGITMMNEAESGTVNMYTVKRNQYWSVEINAVSGCGDSDDDDWKTGPDPDAETYMKATITVEDWDDVERPGGI